MTSQHKKLAAALAFFLVALGIYVARTWQQTREQFHSQTAPPVRRPAPLPQGPPLRWSFQADSSIESTPAIGPDGVLYVNSYKTLYAFSPEGTLLWQYYPGYHLMSSPVVNSGGDVFLADFACYLHRVDAAGKEVFTIQLGTAVPGQNNPETSLDREGMCSLRTPPALYRDEELFVGNTYGSMFAVDGGNGGTRKRFPGIKGSTPIVAPDGYLVAADGNNLTSFGADGSIRWRTTIGARVGSPGITGNAIVVAAADRKLHAFDAGGRPLWEFSGDFLGQPAIDGHGVSYVAGQDGVYAIGADGEKLWKADVVRSSGVTIAADGTLYTGGAARTGIDSYCLYALRPDGTFKWSLPVEGWVQQPPTIGSDGTIYWGTNQNNSTGKVYAVREENGGLAHEGWPKVYGTQANNGNVSGSWQ